MKKITLFFVAILAMVNVANAQRAWAYDLELTPSVDSYTFAFKAVTAGDATLVFYKEGVEAGTLDLGSVSAGANTFTKTSEELLAAIQQSGDFNWGVKMTGGAIGLNAKGFTLEVTDVDRGIYNFYLPQGVAVDNNPESSTFGKIYIAEATNGASDGSSNRADNQKRGIFIYDQTLAELNPTSNVGIIPSNVTLADASRHAMHRIAVNPVNGHVAFAYNIAGSTAVWSVDPNNLAGEATNLIAGLGITKANSICFDENGVLYVMDNGNTSTGGTLVKVENGTLTKIVQNAIWGVEDNSIVSDGRGGIWIAQNRSGIDAYAVLSHVTAAGAIDFKVTNASATALQNLFPTANGNASYRGQCAYNTREDLLAFGGNYRSSVYKVTYDAETGIPSLALSYRTPYLSKNIDGLAFDYAGDLYLLSASAERFYKYSAPTNNNTCTVPAKKAQVITLVSATPEHTVTISVNGNGTVAGANTGTYLEGTELTLTATPADHYDFVNWTGDVTSSTDNPLTITVNSDMTITANFQEHAKYTITASAADNTMGDVNGGGTYYAGETVTLKAVAKNTYYFVNWSDGNTDATRTFIAAADVELTANFAKALPRTWAYDLTLSEDGDNYKFTFTTTSEGTATIHFNDREGNKLYKSHSAGVIEAGTHNVLIAKTYFPQNKDVYWSVQMDGADIPVIAEVTDQSRGIYDFYNMMGVVVDNDPESPYFSDIYIQQSLQYTSGSTAERNKTQTSGIYIYDQGLNEMNSPANTGIQPQLPYTLGGNRQNFKRLTINPTNRHLAFCNNVAGSGAVYSVGMDNLTAPTNNLISHIDEIDNANALCFDKDGNLYVVANVVTNYTVGDIYKIASDGTYTKITPLRPDGKKIWVDEEIAIASDGRGGVWVAQKRDGITQYSALFHVNFEQSKVDFVLEEGQDYSDWFTGTNRRGAIAYDEQRDILAVHGPSAASLFSVAYDGEGVPTITKFAQTHNIGSSNIDGLAFDYAGDLYLVSSGTEKFYKFAVPTNNNTCTTPASQNQIIKKEIWYDVIVNINDNTMGTVNGAGSYLENSQATLTATPTANHRFVNWKEGETILSTSTNYAFTVTKETTLTATFEPIPQYTINVTYDNTMGTVTGDGTYYEGTEVTLTAKANGGYVFVKWNDEVTSETRTFTAIEDVELQAIFEKAVSRAWAYDLNVTEEGEDYKFTFMATTAGEATLLFKDDEGNEVVTSHSLGLVDAGAHTVSLPKSTFTGIEVDVYWYVKIEGEAITKMAEVTDPTKGIYNFVCPQGIAVDNNPNSKHFGQIYVAAATDGTVDRGNQTRGIFVYNQALEELNTPNAGYLPSNATLTNTTRQAIHRVAVNPVNGQVTFAYNVSGSSAVWSMNPDNLAGNAVNLIDGAGITKANSLCFDEDGALYVMDNANTTTGGNIYKIQNGEANMFATAQKGYHWGVEENAMSPDGRGGLWIAQNRWQVDGYPVLSHIDKNGVVDFAVTSSSPEALKALFPNDDNNASYRGQCAYYVADDILAFAGNKEAVLFKVTYDANNTPTNLEKLMSTGKLGTNIDGVAFDYAGDLYVASETTHRFYKFVVPTNDNTCTVPARQKVINNVKLYDNVNNNDILSALNDNLTENVAIYRSLTAGMYNTLCLPFDIDDISGTPLENATIWQYNDAKVKGEGDSKEIFLEFTEVISLKAGQPYLVEPEEDIEAPMEFRGVKISAIKGYAVGSFEAVTMQGILHPTELQANDKSILFLVANNELAWANVTANMNGMRAYFQVNEPSLQSARTRAYIRKAPTVATDMENITTTDTEIKKVIYNGNIYIIRGDEVYTIQGTKVK